MSPAVRERLFATVDAMPEELQLRVPEFAESLSTPLPKGRTGHQMRRVVGLIPHESLMTMAAAIEDGCEKVDASEW